MATIQKQRTAFPEELRLRFKTLISSRCGLYFRDYNLKDLEAVLGKRMAFHRFDAPLSYYQYLTGGDKCEEEFRELLNLLTVNHTYFFRNEPQFKAFKEKILPEIIQRETKDRPKSAGASLQTPSGLRKPKLRIWSAGCSSGEEPYSIAILVREAIQDLENWDVEILATDVSSNALDRARAGVYGKTAIRSVPADYLDRYFTLKPGREPQYEIAGLIKRMIGFSYLNLIEDVYPAGFDVIFCRNVVIYFDLETTMKVMNAFHSSLRDDGTLFIGYSESLQFVCDRFKMQDWEDAIYYRKGTREAIPKFEMPKAISERVSKFIEEISKAAVAADEKKAEPLKKCKTRKEIESLRIEIVKSIYLKRYHTALSLLDEALLADPEAMDLYYLAGEVYSNLGRFKEAREHLEKALKLNSLFAPAHYLESVISVEQNELEKAKKSLKKALFLDKDFAMAHFSLANLHRNQGSVQESIREYRNTLRTLSGQAQSDLVAYSGGFNAATLASVCKDNIERLKIAE